MLPLYSVLFCASEIVTGNKTGIPSDVLVDSLALCGTIICRLNLSSRSPLTKVLLLVVIES